MKAFEAFEHIQNIKFKCLACTASNRFLFDFAFAFHTSTRGRPCMNWALLTRSFKCGWMNSISWVLKRIKSNYWPIVEEKAYTSNIQAQAQAQCTMPKPLYLSLIQTLDHFHPECLGCMQCGWRRSTHRLKTKAKWQNEIVLKHLKRYKRCYWAWTRAPAPQRVRGDRAKIRCRSKCFGCMCYLNELLFLHSHAIAIAIAIAITLASPTLCSCTMCAAANMWFSPFQTFQQLFQKCWW